MMAFLDGDGDGCFSCIYSMCSSNYPNVMKQHWIFDMVHMMSSVLLDIVCDDDAYEKRSYTGFYI